MDKKPFYQSTLCKSMIPPYRYLLVIFAKSATGSNVPLAMFTVALSLFGAAVSQQFPSGWEPDTAAWGDFPSVPYATWDSVQPTADMSTLSSVRSPFYPSRLS